jgi:nucleoid-associated protein EbfC
VIRTGPGRPPRADRGPPSGVDFTWREPRASPLHVASVAAMFSPTLSRRFDRIFMTNFQQLFQLGQQVQARLSQLQTELGNRTITCSSGGGMVSVTADGKGRIREIRIDPSVVDPGDVEMLEDLVIAAVTEAQQRAEQIYEEEMKKVAGGLPLPFSIPNFP